MTIMVIARNLLIQIAQNTFISYRTSLVVLLTHLKSASPDNTSRHLNKASETHAGSYRGSLRLTIILVGPFLPCKDRA